MKLITPAGLIFMAPLIALMVFGLVSMYQAKRRDRELYRQASIDEKERNRLTQEFLNDNGITLSVEAFEKLSKSFEIAIDGVNALWSIFRLERKLLLFQQTYEGEIEDVWFLPIDNIVFFTKDGAVTYTNKVNYKSDGNNTSISGAVVGGLIAGDAGAIIGSRKEPDISITNTTEEHDDVRVYLYYIDETSNSTKSMELLSNGAYRYLVQTIPEKEYSVVQQSIVASQREEKGQIAETENDSIEGSLQKLKNLYDKGLIDEKEYKSKKEDILRQL